MATRERRQAIGWDVPPETDLKQQREADRLQPWLLGGPAVKGGAAGIGQGVRLALSGSLFATLDEASIGHPGQLAVHLATGQRPEVADDVLGGRRQIPARHRPP